ncbi:MAG: SDR family NAD(P)-dependent oxidoreductase [Lachnospiraceae bacterium]
MKYAFVTGADRGLGFAFCTELLERGYYVFAGQYMPDWKELEGLKAKYLEQLTMISLDISSDVSVKTACVKIKEACPYINLLINNAGITGDNDTSIFGELDFDDMMKVYNVNTLGPLRVTNGIVDHVLKSDDKTIVTISSEAGSIGDCWRDRWFAYAMSKCALNMQGALVHKAITPEGGRLVLIHPGFVQSYMSGTLNEKARDTGEECAKGVLKVVLDDEVVASEMPEYKDFKGKDLPW